MGRTVKALILFFLMTAFTGTASASEDIAAVVAVRGQATIERDKKEIEAKVKDGILLNDTVSTREASKAKMLFIDDSVLSLSEKSKVVIKEFVYSKDKGGKSIFNLIDGKMRTVVGKTSFEVHTPTAIAAARGTVINFETGIRDGKLFTTIICLEGEVYVMSIDPSINGSVTLTPGMMITVFEKKPLPAPRSGAGASITDIPHAPQINQQPANKTPVNIDVVFPR